MSEDFNANFNEGVEKFNSDQSIEQEDNFFYLNYFAYPLYCFLIRFINFEISFLILFMFANEIHLIIYIGFIDFIFMVNNMSFINQVGLIAYFNLIVDIDDSTSFID